MKKPISKEQITKQAKKYLSKSMKSKDPEASEASMKKALRYLATMYRQEARESARRCYEAKFNSEVSARR